MAQLVASADRRAIDRCLATTVLCLQQRPHVCDDGMQHSCTSWCRCRTCFSERARTLQHTAATWRAGTATCPVDNRATLSMRGFVMSAPEQMHLCAGGLMLGSSSLVSRQLAASPSQQSCTMHRCWTRPGLHEAFLARRCVDTGLLTGAAKRAENSWRCTADGAGSRGSAGCYHHCI